MDGIYIRRDAQDTWQTTQILRYVGGLIKERGGKNIHGRLPEGGPRRLPGGNNWEGRDACGHTPYLGPERGGTCITGRAVHARIP